MSARLSAAGVPRPPRPSAPVACFPAGAPGTTGSVHRGVCSGLRVPRVSAFSESVSSSQGRLESPTGSGLSLVTSPVWCLPPPNCKRSLLHLRTLLDVPCRFKVFSAAGRTRLAPGALGSRWSAPAPPGTVLWPVKLRVGARFLNSSSRLPRHFRRCQVKTGGGQRRRF